MMKKYWILILMLVSTASFAKEGWLIVTQNELLNLNGQIVVEVIKPTAVAAWPNSLTLNLSSQNAHEEVELVPTELADNNRRRYMGLAKTKFDGTVRAELAGRDSNRLLMAANTVEAVSNAVLADNQHTETQRLAAKETQSGEGGSQEVKESSNRVYISEPKEDRTITANEPLYFIIGSSDERNFDARFQLSFKYRPFDPEARVAKFIPYASNLYFAYTQTSIWDLGGESSPFKDTSYRPSIYYNWAESGKGYNPNSWKFGLEHESNGRDGSESRSMNIAFVQPSWNIDFSGGKQFTFMPRFYSYIEKSDNRDMHHYRGYVDWIARYGRDDAAILTALYRQGTEGYVQGQLDLSYPISDKIFGRTGTFLHFQLLGGYGETLIDYNRSRDTQLRVGISLAR